ncbi:hypothetical protein HanRHA438_Chr15g0712781 [Helianthus annuus]|nr:hypothetical protein HanPI659440_Chr15g0600381 [Helianthus annuus]KAJ0845363.1 hypothetical protein HanRHA438_Chr15g0712781 [Helianthus annuus]
MVPKTKTSPRSRQCQRHKLSANLRPPSVEDDRIKKEATAPLAKRPTNLGQKTRSSSSQGLGSTSRRILKLVSVILFFIFKK